MFAEPEKLLDVAVLSDLSYMLARSVCILIGKAFGPGTAVSTLEIMHHPHLGLYYPPGDEALNDWPLC
jgi:hypothetical protein